MYKKTSPYASTQLNSWYLGYYRHRSIPAAADDFIVQINKNYEGRPDKIALDYLGDTKYWWVIVVRNMEKIKDPIADLTLGKIIYLPRKDRLTQLLG